MVRGLCRYNEIHDGTLDLADIAEMNDILDVQDENDLRARRAAIEQRE